MKWPWISRTAHDAIVAESAKRNLDLGNRLTTLEARYDALVEKYTAKSDPPPSLVRRMPDPVTQAILAKSGSDQRLRKHFAAFVTEQRAAGLDEEAIAAAIRMGEDDMGGVP